MKSRKMGWVVGMMLIAALAGAAEVAKKAIPKAPPTAAEAKVFVEEAEARLMKLWIDPSRADWVKSTYITDDTETLAAQANEKAISAGVEYAKKAARFDGLKLPADIERKLKLLKLSLTLAAPADPKEAAES